MAIRSKNDPARKQKIAKAALEILAEEGVEALTFRQVAESAGVPLGSTSYYFSSREDLISAAVEEFYTSTVELYASSIERLISEYGELGGLAMLIEEMTTRRRKGLRRDYRIYFLLIDRPELLAHTPGWEFEALLKRYFLPARAKVLSFMFEGVLMDSVMYDRPYFFAEMHKLLETAFSN